MSWLLPTLFACTPSSPADSGSTEDRGFSYPLDDVLTLADAQVKGTHNSYHVEPDPLAVLEWGYTHAALDVQARELGVRQFELDVHIDPDGGDLTVFHVPLVDDASTCATLGECLGLLASWSRDNPAHLPILVMIEPKGEFDGQDFAGRLDLIDESIAAAWPRDATVAMVIGAATRGVGGGSACRSRHEKWELVGQGRGAFVGADGRAGCAASSKQASPYACSHVRAPSCEVRVARKT